MSPDGGDNGGAGPVDNAGGSPDNTGLGSPQGEPQVSQDDALNPAWNPLLEKLPGGLHNLVTPTLRDWDKNYRDLEGRYNEVQSRWEPFKDVEPDKVGSALGLYDYIEQNPEAFWKALGEQYGFGVAGDQGQQNGNSDTVSLEQEGEESNPVLDELRQNQQVLAQHFVQQQQAEQEAQLNQQIEAEMAQVIEKHPELESDDMKIMVFQLATASGSTLTEAAQRLVGHNQAIAQASQPKPGPSVMGNTSNTVPAAENVDPRKLNSQDTKKLVANILEQRFGNG